MFSTNDCLNTPSDLIRLWLHETHRVYGDKLTDDKDIDAFLKLQVDICKKNFDVCFNECYEIESCFIVIIFIML